MKSQTNTGYVAFLSVVAAIGGILFGYDTAVISGTVTGVSAQFGLDACSRDGSSAVRSSVRSAALRWPASSATVSAAG